MYAVEFHQQLIDKKIPILVDSDQVYCYFSKQGYPTCFFERHEFTQQEASLAIFSDYSYRDKLKKIYQTSKNTLVHFPAVKFDGSLEAIIYSWERLINCDIKQGLIMRDKAYEKIANTEAELSLYDDQGSQLICRLAKNLEVANTDKDLKTGWFYSLIELWESSILNMTANKSSFSLAGKFFFEGIIYCTIEQETKKRNQKKLDYLFDLVRQSKQKYIEIEDNAITRLVLDDQDRTSLLGEMNYELEQNLSITEMAFGCDTNLVKNVNWNVNSMINQGIYGMHLGIGTGEKCPYIDFITTRITLV